MKRVACQPLCNLVRQGELAKACDVAVISEALGVVLSDPLLRDQDGVHANLVGYKTLAKIIANALKQF